MHPDVLRNHNGVPPPYVVSDEFDSGCNSSIRATSTSETALTEQT